MLTHTSPNPDKVPGFWKVPYELSPILLGCKAAPKTKEIAKGVWLAENVISDESCDAINRLHDFSPNYQAVSVQGMKDIRGPEDIGSYRTTTWNPYLAQEFERLFYWTDFPDIVNCEDTTSTDFWQNTKCRKYVYEGVSPLLRAMTYKEGNKHACHYDAAYLYPDSNYRTLLSFVAYFSTNKTGATRIIRDGQETLPVWERNHSDWDREERPEEIIAESLPVKGNVLFFFHRIPHSVSKFIPEIEGEERRIIRGDLVYHALEN